jgi:hypothetical protein
MPTRPSPVLVGSKRCHEMARDERVRSLEEAEVHIQSLTARIAELERLISDHSQRFDTLQTAWYKRLWFRIDGWPGIRNLNADRKAWRPWRRWTS